MGEELSNLIKTYCALDDESRDLNSRLIELRTRKNQHEQLLIEKLKTTPATKIEISADNSYIRVKRPSTWSKAWNMSQKDLHTFITTAYEHCRTAEELYKFIVEHKKSTLVSEEFAIERVVRGDRERE